MKQISQGPGDSIAGCSYPFSVVVPRAPVYGLLGSSVTLPCSISPPLNAVNFEVLWFRPQEGHTPIVFYQDLEIRKNPRNPQYQGRVSLIGGLDKGNVSVKLENIRLEDKGEYICRVEKTDEGEEWYDEATVSLQVKGEIQRQIMECGSTYLNSGVFEYSFICVLHKCVVMMVGVCVCVILCMCRVMERSLYGRPHPLHPPSDVQHWSRSLLCFFTISYGGSGMTCTQPKEKREEYSSKIFTLCKQRFSSGQQYWELKVKEDYNQKRSWYVGVATEEADRINGIKFTPARGFWVLFYEEGKGVYIRESPTPTPLSHNSEDLNVIGVFLDCDNHTLSFYNAETQSLIYTYTSVTFITSLRPLIIKNYEFMYETMYNCHTLACVCPVFFLFWFFPALVLCSLVLFTCHVSQPCAAVFWSCPCLSPALSSVTPPVSFVTPPPHYLHRCPYTLRNISTDLYLKEYKACRWGCTLY
uniref:Ig-like domain-containing protein n=1 Tax=Astyanax mexicanus TaxID=7994 RepID=A0A3B1KK38_ASTMX